MSSDDRAVEAIRLVIQNQTTQRFFDGQAWQPQWTFVTLPVAVDGSWSYQLPETSGTIYLGSRAVDDSGNIQKSPGFTYFFATGRKKR